MKVYGTVIDESGDPIPGANIASATYHTIVESSDSNGKFELDNEKITNISPIKISYVGYKDVYVKAQDLQGSKVTLQEYIIPLREVVITQKPKVTEPVPNSRSLTEHIKKYQGPYIVLLSLVIMGTGFALLKKST